MGPATKCLNMQGGLLQHGGHRGACRLESKPLPRANLNWLARAMGRKPPSSVARAPVVQKCILPLNAYVHTNTWEIQFFRYCIAKTFENQKFFTLEWLSASGCHHVLIMFKRSMSSFAFLFVLINVDFSNQMLVSAIKLI